VSSKAARPSRSDIAVSRRARRHRNSHPSRAPRWRAAAHAERARRASQRARKSWVAGCYSGFAQAHRPRPDQVAVEPVAARGVITRKQTMSPRFGDAEAAYFHSRFNLASKCSECAMVSRLLANLSMSSAPKAARRSSASADLRAHSIVFAKQRATVGWGITHSLRLQAGARPVSQPPAPKDRLPVIMVSVTQGAGTGRGVGGRARPSAPVTIITRRIGREISMGSSQKPLIYGRFRTSNRCR
jgi:hypothetical protein